MKIYHLILILSAAAGFAYGAVGIYAWYHGIKLPKAWDRPFDIALPFTVFAFVAFGMALIGSFLPQR